LIDCGDDGALANGWQYLEESKAIINEVFSKVDSGGFHAIQSSDLGSIFGTQSASI